MKFKLLGIFVLLTTLAFSATSNQSANQSVTITVQNVTALTITPPATVPKVTILNGVPQVYAGATFTASGGVAPYTWSITSGSLPAGLGVTTSGTNGANGVIGGTPLVTAATSTFTLTVTDSTSTVSSVDLKWDPNPTGVTANAIYRGTTKGGPYTQIAKTLQPVNTYSESVQTHGLLVYVVTAINKIGESLKSKEVAVVLP